MSRHHEEDDSYDDDAAFLDLDTVQTVELPPSLQKPEAPTLESLQTKAAKTRAKRYEEKQLQRGVVYLSRIPPKITPHRIRQMLSKFGELGRVFLKQESQEATNLRKKLTRGVAAARYDCGWVEFLDKRRAKRAALMLQGQPMGSTAKTRTHADDLWQIEYLSKVKWNDLREESAHKSQIKSNLLTKNREIAVKETGLYIQRVEWNKKRERRHQQQQQQQTDKDITPVSPDEKDVGHSQQASKKQRLSRALNKDIDQTALVKLGHRSL